MNKVDLIYGLQIMPCQHLQYKCLLFFFFQLGLFRYNCNRYNEDDAKAARDAQEVVNIFIPIDTKPLHDKHLSHLTELVKHNRQEILNVNIMAAGTLSLEYNPP